MAPSTRTADRTRADGRDDLVHVGLFDIDARFRVKRVPVDKFVKLLQVGYDFCKVIYNWDVAFWGKTAYQGNYSGFRIVDVSDPENPVELKNYEECSPGTTQGNQGDVIVWENLLVRSWNSPATTMSHGSMPTRSSTRRRSS